MTGPVAGTERIASLDTIRGVAVLGILPMNALVFGLDRAAYFNVSADGIRHPLDWILGVATMVLVDQKMMALFSLLFGVGVVVFAERVASRGRAVIGLCLRRFALLFAVGLAHGALWFGDVLALYALCAPVVLMVRRLPSRVLGTAGVGLALAGTAAAPLVQSAAGGSPAALGDFWFAHAAGASPLVTAWFGLNAAGRALGLMLIGVVLHRLGIVQGTRDDAFYRRLAAWGLGIGFAVTASGSAWRITTGWSAEHAITGTIPAGIATIPMALGYMAAIILGSRRGGRLVEHLRNAGRMALTNYLAQTALGLVTLTWLLHGIPLTRTLIAVWIVGVWALQLTWSTWWLERFAYGPFEWTWRCATYGAMQPARRRRTAA